MTTHDSSFIFSLSLNWRTESHLTSLCKEIPLQPQLGDLLFVPDGTLRDTLHGTIRSRVHCLWEIVTVFVHSNNKRSTPSDSYPVGPWVGGSQEVDIPGSTEVVETQGLSFCLLLPLPVKNYSCVESLKGREDECRKTGLESVYSCGSTFSLNFTLKIRPVDVRLAFKRMTPSPPLVIGLG